MKPKPTFYSVHVVKDGTICLARQTIEPQRRPRQRSQTPDEDGCHGWTLLKPDDIRSFSDWGKGVVHGAIVNRLNLKKALSRAQVEPRLSAIEDKLRVVVETLARIEERLTASREL